MLGFTRLLALLASGVCERSITAAAAMPDPPPSKRAAIVAAIRNLVFITFIRFSLTARPVGSHQQDGLHVAHGIFRPVYPGGNAEVDLVLDCQGVGRVIGRILAASSAGDRHGRATLPRPVDASRKRAQAMDEVEDGVAARVHHAELEGLHRLRGIRAAPIHTVEAPLSPVARYVEPILARGVVAPWRL